MISTQFCLETVILLKVSLFVSLLAQHLLRPLKHGEKFCYAALAYALITDKQGYLFKSYIKVFYRSK